VKDRFRRVLPYLFVALVAASRWPGFMPPNFSAVYALVFCAGAFFPGTISWRAPLGLLLVSDLVLNGYYQWVKGYSVLNAAGMLYLTCNYLGYATLWWLGRRFRGTRNVIGLLGGGILGALVFYLVTNTAAWWLNPFRNPEYARTLAGWVIALTRGTGGYPETWEFFRNTLFSGGLFTALFGAAWRLTTPAESPVEKGEVSPPAEEAKPEEVQA
jgi:hypothetical protein